LREREKQASVTVNLLKKGGALASFSIPDYRSIPDYSSMGIADI
jgi:hypothetical protein